MLRLARAGLCAALVLANAPAAAQVSGLTGTLVVTNKSTASATIIDVATGQAIATLPTGNGPHEIAMTRDGRIAVVTDYGTGPAPGHTLTVIDVPAQRVVRTVELGEYTRPHGIAWLPGDSLVAVTSEQSRNLVIVAIPSGGIRKVIPTTQAGSHMVGVTADGRRAWTGNIGSNTVSEIDLVKGETVRTIPVPNQPEAINVTPDGVEVWVGSNQMDRVSVVDPSTASVTTVAEGMGWPYRVLFTPDLKTVVLPDLEGNTVRFIDRASRRELSRIELPGAGPQGVTMTPDGRYLFESLSTQSRVVVIDMTTRQVVGHIPAGPTPDGVVYTTRVIR